MLRKLFGFKRETMSINKEVVGGVTTFLTMAYILSVNPAVLSSTGMDKGAVFTATGVSALVGTLIMSLYAKLPYALAPSMGLNAFFAYTVVLVMGYSWQFALTAVFIEGIIFIVLTLTGVRQVIVESMPLILRQSISPGIGLFIAFIGLKNACIIDANESTFVTLGDVRSPSVLLACFGIMLTGMLLVRKIPGAMLLGILVTSVAGIPLGITTFEGVAGLPPSLSPVFFRFEFENILSFDMLICVVAFLFVDMFDTIGTLIGMSNRAGMVDKDGNVPHMREAFMADAVATTAGAVLGTSSVSTFVESAAAVEAGGRSGLTSFVTSVCFALALFLAPLFLAIPYEATAPALFIIGVMMLHDIRKIDFSDLVNGIPCFICIVFMPLTYSISNGIMLGLISYAVMHVLAGNWRKIGIGTYILVGLFVLKYAFV